MARRSGWKWGGEGQRHFTLSDRGGAFPPPCHCQVDKNHSLVPAAAAGHNICNCYFSLLKNYE